MTAPLREELALFPLSTVLFPGALLPLHIFEPRYRELVQTLVELPAGAPREFGVVAIRAGREVGRHGVQALYPVGCTAVLASVTPHSDGRFDIVCIGSRRFELRGVEPAGTAYLTGSVHRLEEPAGVQVPGLAEGLAVDLVAYRALVGRPPRQVADDPRQLSYQVAGEIVLDVADRQRLLATPDTTARLLAERALLRRELGLVAAFRAVPSLDVGREPYPLS